MLPLIAVLILLFTPLVMLIIRLTRPNFAYLYLAAVAGALVTWPIILLARPSAPELIPFAFWDPGLPGISTPAFLIDSISWPFALAVSTLGLAVILTAVARPAVDWRAWAGSLTLAGLGIFSVLAGNPLTLLAAWAAIDMVEIIILFVQITKSETRERIVAVFTARAAGTLMLIWATASGRSAGLELDFNAIHPQLSIYVFLAVGMRLGVLPMHVPFLREIPIRRGLGTMLRLVPTASSLAILVRAAQAGVPAGVEPYLLGLSGLAALYGGWAWATADSELAGRPFWILVTTSLAFASALRGVSEAALAWGLAGIYSGGLIFLASARPRPLLILLGLGLLGISTLPLTPAWAGVRLYSVIQPASAPASLLALIFLPAQVLLLAGYARHSLRPGEDLASSERYIRLLYPLGLTFLPAAHFLSAGIPAQLSQPHLFSEWLAGLVILALGIVLWAYRHAFTRPQAGMESFAKRLFSLSWMYRTFWWAYRGAGRLVGVMSLILEGEGGVLWSLVLLALLLSLLAQSGFGRAVTP